MPLLSIYAAYNFFADATLIDDAAFSCAHAHAHRPHNSHAHQHICCGLLVMPRQSATAATPPSHAHDAIDTPLRVTTRHASTVAMPLLRFCYCMLMLYADVYAAAAADSAYVTATSRLRPCHCCTLRLR